MVGDLNSYKSYIESLPSIDNPNVFGMHDNANITFQTQETTALINVVLNLQPRDTGGGNEATPEEKVTELVNIYFRLSPRKSNFDFKDSSV